MDKGTDTLLHIAKNGFREMKSSTSRIAKELNVSQQTVSRKLRELEEKGLIKRKASPNGISASISDKGIALLREQYDGLCRIFEPKKQHFTAVVKTGIREGKYYVSMPRYQKEFKQKLGFSAYPGTLNLAAEPAEIKMLLNAAEPIKISGFETKSRTYGQIICYRAKVNGINSAIVIPERTRYGEDTVEVISHVRLREKLKLKDGDKVKVTLT